MIHETNVVYQEAKGNFFMKIKKKGSEQVEKSAAKSGSAAKSKITKTKQSEKIDLAKPLATSSEKTVAANWTFFSNHSHVLICLAREPDLRLRDVAERVGITERGVQRIVADLEEAGILSRARDGRRNHYEVHAERPLRHAVEAHCTVNDLLKIVEVN